jgi:hypothetical protein
MDFRAFLENFERQELQFIGKLPVILGTKESETLNYGGAEHFGKPFLYIPIHGQSQAAKALKTIRRNAEKQNRALYCVADKSQQGGFMCHQIGPKKLGPMGEILEDPQDIGKANRAKIASVGEMHVTVAYGKELEEVKPDLIAKYNLPENSGMSLVLGSVKIADDKNMGIWGGSPIFQYWREGGIGVRTPVYTEDPKAKPKFVVASSYKIPRIGDLPPIAAIVPVKCDMVGYIRKALGLETDPSNVTHVTIGFVIPTEESVAGILTSRGRKKGEETSIGQLNPQKLAQEF